jgi:hypothetical protein
MYVRPPIDHTAWELTGEPVHDDESTDRSTVAQVDDGRFTIDFHTQLRLHHGAWCGRGATVARPFAAPRLTHLHADPGVVIRPDTRHQLPTSLEH